MHPKLRLRFPDRVLDGVAVDINFSLRDWSSPDSAVQTWGKD
jgi:hypothetical protein